MDKIKEMLLQDKATFVEYLEKVKRKKLTLLNPNTCAKVNASAGVIAYIDSVLGRLEKE